MMAHGRPAQKNLERQLVRPAREYQVCRRLATVPGVGAITSLAFVTTIDDPSRFLRSADVGGSSWASGTELSNQIRGFLKTFGITLGGGVDGAFEAAVIARCPADPMVRDAMFALLATICRDHSEWMSRRASRKSISDIVGTGKDRGAGVIQKSATAGLARSPSHGGTTFRESAN